MAKRLLIVGVALLFIGGVGAVAYRVTKGKKCFFACHKRDPKIVNSFPSCCAKKAPSTLSTEEVAAFPNEKKLDLEYSDCSLDFVLKDLAQRGLNVVYSAPLVKDLKVSANLKQVSIYAAGIAVLKAVGVKFELTTDMNLIVIGR